MSFDASMLTMLLMFPSSPLTVPENRASAKRLWLKSFSAQWLRYREKIRTLTNATSSCADNWLKLEARYVCFAFDEHFILWFVRMEKIWLCFFFWKWDRGASSCAARKIQPPLSSSCCACVDFTSPCGAKKLKNFENSRHTWHLFSLHVRLFFLYNTYSTPTWSRCKPLSVKPSNTRPQQSPPLAPRPMRLPWRLLRQALLVAWQSFLETRRPWPRMRTPRLARPIPWITMKMIPTTAMMKTIERW